MPDPNFENPISNPGQNDVFGALPTVPPGAQNQLNAGIGQQLGQAPGTAGNVDIANLRQFVPKDYQVLTFDLSVERNDELIQFPKTFSFIKVTNSTNLTDVLKIRYESASADAIDFLAGTFINGMPFTALYLTNAIIAAATMQLLVVQNWPVDQVATDG